MPSNVELRRRIRKKAGELGVKVPDLKDLNNAKLQACLSGLKPPEIKRRRYVVTREVLVSRGRVFLPGEVIGSNSLGGGGQAFEALINRGLIEPYNE